jgi:hypothetical protein
VEYDDHFWADKDGNDLLLMLIVVLPQFVWLELYGDLKSVCFAPWLRVCFWLNIRPAKLKELLPVGHGKHGYDIFLWCSVLTRSRGESRQRMHVSMTPRPPKRKTAARRERQPEGGIRFIGKRIFAE